MGSPDVKTTTATRIATDKNAEQQRLLDAMPPPVLVPALYQLMREMNFPPQLLEVQAELKDARIKYNQAIDNVVVAVAQGINQALLNCNLPQLDPRPLLESSHAVLKGLSIERLVAGTGEAEMLRTAELAYNGVLKAFVGQRSGPGADFMRLFIRYDGAICDLARIEGPAMKGPDSGPKGIEKRALKVLKDILASQTEL
jgi:hypothetical protein